MQSERYSLAGAQSSLPINAASKSPKKKNEPSLPTAGQSESSYV